MSRQNGKGAALTPDPKNARRHGERNKSLIRESLQTVGPLRSIGVDGDNIIRAGNGVYDQAQALGLKVRVVDAAPDELIAVRRQDLKGKRAIEAALFDNRAGEVESTWNVDVLAEIAERDGDLLRRMFEGDKDVLAAIGPQEQEDAEPQIDRADALLKKWKVRTGDLFRVGEHRLLCGDSTKRENVERVMQGEKAGATVTDPPYGVGIDYGSFADTSENVKKLIDAVMPIIFDHLPAALTPGVPAMWDYPRPAWVGAWIHPAPAGGCPWGFVGNNPILFYGADPYLKTGKGRRPDSVVMSSDRQGEDRHPTPKPLKVWAWLIERMTTQAGQIIFDPFSGSGTGLVACQNLRRKCRAIEISPAYCAVTLERMATAFPGIEIERLDANTQKPKARRKRTQTAARK